MKSYFKGCELARMSDGTYCIIRPLGLVKGGKGLRHHENLLTLSAAGLASKLAQVFRGLSGFLGMAVSGKVPMLAGRMNDRPPQFSRPATAQKLPQRRMGDRVGRMPSIQ